MWYFIIAIGYFLSAFLMWLWIHVYYSERGIRKGETPQNEEFWFTILPGVNTLFSLVAWIFIFPIEISSINLKKFFKIK